MNIHFISGLPRAGSTLLAALLRQNPRFHAEMSSPVGQIFSAMQRAISAQNEAACFIDDNDRERLLRVIIETYYKFRPWANNGVSFDTSRQWCSKLPLITQLFPDAKIICCVRDPAWCLDSLERLIRTNPLQTSGIFGYEPNNTVYSRCESLIHSNGMIGHALDSFREAFYSPEAKRLFVLDYEALAKKPKESIAELYEFINEPLFEHDFENVSYSAQEFDTRLGTPNLHTVCGPIIWNNTRVPCLPPSLFKKYTNTFWRDSIENLGARIVTVGVRHGT